MIFSSFFTKLLIWLDRRLSSSRLELQPYLSSFIFPIPSLCTNSCSLSSLMLLNFSRSKSLSFWGLLPLQFFGYKQKPCKAIFFYVLQNSEMFRQPQQTFLLWPRCVDFTIPTSTSKCLERGALKDTNCLLPLMKLSHWILLSKRFSRRN